MSCRIAITAVYIALSITACAVFGGCQWYDSLRGPGFPGWEESSSMRGKNSESHGSGLVYSRKAEQVEKNLGGDY
jgi:hypothetical protein